VMDLRAIKPPAERVIDPNQGVIIAKHNPSMDCSFSTPPIVAVLGCHIAEAKVCWKSHGHRMHTVLIRLMPTRDGVGAPALFFRKVLGKSSITTVRFSFHYREVKRRIFVA
jgi:hypothetical protein